MQALDTLRLIPGNDARVQLTALSCLVLHGQTLFSTEGRSLGHDH